MNRPRVVRLLRIGWSAGWVISCLLLIILWVRRNSTFDQCIGHFPTGTNFELESTQGTIFLGIGIKPGGQPLLLQSLDLDESALNEIRRQPKFKFMDHTVATPVVNTVPHWFVVIVSGIFIAVPWLRWRFSLRTLLIATTLVAVVLGLIVYAMRK